MKFMRLSDLKAGSGEKQTLLLPVTSPYPVEMTVICGCRPGKTLVVTAGVHGCEYVGIETLNQLKKELNPAALSGRVILLPLVNPEGFYHGSKQPIPADADFLMDLHGGDVNEALTPLIFFPTAVEKSLSAAASSAAESLSVPYRVTSTSRNGLYSWAAQCGIPALLVERGERGLWSGEEVSACRENVYELMRHLGILHVDMVSSCFPQTEIRKAIYKEAPADGFWYPAVSEAGQKLKQGALLGTLKDSYGNEIARYTAPFEGVVLYYTLSLGVRSGDPLIAYGKL